MPIIYTSMLSGYSLFHQTIKFIIKKTSLRVEKPCLFANTIDETIDTLRKLTSDENENVTLKDTFRLCTDKYR